LYILFKITGLAITAVGFILRYGYDYYKPALDLTLKLLKETLAKTTIGTFATDEVDLGEVIIMIQRFKHMLELLPFLTIIKYISSSR